MSLFYTNLDIFVFLCVAHVVVGAYIDVWGSGCGGTSMRGYFDETRLYVWRLE